MTRPPLPLVPGTPTGVRVDPDALGQAAAVCELDDGCITCGDVAVVLEVVALDGADARCVDEHGREEVVAVELVDAAVGDRLVVHAKVALETVDHDTPLGRLGSR